MQFLPFFLPRTPHTQLQSLSLSLSQNKSREASKQKKQKFFSSSKETHKTNNKKRKKEKSKTIIISATPLDLSAYLIVFTKHFFKKQKQQQIHLLLFPSDPFLTTDTLFLSLSLSIRPSFLLFPKKLTFY